jgi:hypothetical protein
MPAGVILVCLATFGSSHALDFYSNQNDYYEEASGVVAPPGVFEALDDCGQSFDMTDCLNAAKKVEVGGQWKASCVRPDHPHAKLQIEAVEH